MKALLQRVISAEVISEERLLGKIGKGYLILLGIGNEDTADTADKMIEKIRKLRLFEDADGKTNLSVTDVEGEILVVSQFTLYADCRKGTRPGFSNAASPVVAEELYDYFVKACIPHFKAVEHGSFGDDMKVTLTNDGPFTIMLEL